MKTNFKVKFLGFYLFNEKERISSERNYEGRVKTRLINNNKQK